MARVEAKCGRLAGADAHGAGGCMSDVALEIIDFKDDDPVADRKVVDLSGDDFSSRFKEEFTAEVPWLSRILAPEKPSPSSAESGVATCMAPVSLEESWRVGLTRAPANAANTRMTTRLRLRQRPEDAHVKRERGPCEERTGSTWILLSYPPMGRWVAGALGQTYRTLERALRAKAEKSLGESTGGRVDCRKRVIFSLRRTFWRDRKVRRWSIHLL